MSDLDTVSMNVMAGCMAVQKGEGVLVICDKPLRRVGRALWEAGRELDSEAMLLEIVPRSAHGEEPPAAVAALMREVDVLLCPTTWSLTHTEARRRANEAGARIATMPGITEDCMLRTLSADYDRIARRSTAAARALSEGSAVRVSSPSGTEIEFSIEGRSGHSDTGLVHEPGGLTNLPAGEGYIAPVEGTAHGVIVFEAAVAGLGKLGEEKITLTVEDGYAVGIEGGDAARRLGETLDRHGREARNIAELGIGTNDMARVSGMILEDEKILGTVHLALGDNRSMGGSVGVESHIDGLVLEPTVWIDGRKVLDRGRLLI